MKQIVLQPVTRIEGHAKVTIQLDDQGNVADARVNVVELRGFERFAIGRPVGETDAAGRFTGVLKGLDSRVAGCYHWHKR